MSVTTSNFQYPTLKWREKGDPTNLLMTNTEPDNISSTVDDGLTSLSWLQNLNMCMTRLGAPTPPTPPASPVCFGLNYQLGNWKKNSTPRLPACVGNKCKAASSSGDNVQRGESCSQASATIESKRNGTKVQSEPKVQPASSHKSESKKKASSQNKPTGALKPNKKKLPQYSPIYSEQPRDEVVDYKLNGDIKPPYSYATLICMAMKANKNKMSLSSIYQWIKENFLYYRNADPSWQVWLIEWNCSVMRHWGNEAEKEREWTAGSSDSPNRNVCMHSFIHSFRLRRTLQPNNSRTEAKKAKEQHSKEAKTLNIEREREREKGAQYPMAQSIWNGASVSWQRVTSRYKHLDRALPLQQQPQCPPLLQQTGQ